MRELSVMRDLQPTDISELPKPIPELLTETVQAFYQLGYNEGIRAYQSASLRVATAASLRAEQSSSRAKLEELGRALHAALAAQTHTTDRLHIEQALAHLTAALDRMNIAYFDEFPVAEVAFEVERAVHYLTTYGSDDG
jgi:hypothetical protein